MLRSLPPARERAAAAARPPPGDDRRRGGARRSRSPWRSSSFVLTRTHGGTPPPANLPPRRTARWPSRSPRTRPRQYNPFGTSPENPSNAGLAIDGDREHLLADVDLRRRRARQVGRRPLRRRGARRRRQPRGRPDRDAGLRRPGLGRRRACRRSSYTPLPRPGSARRTLGWTLLGQRPSVARQAADRALARAPAPLLPALDHEPRPGPDRRLEDVQIAEFTLEQAQPATAAQKR